jgi:hypothetical protein
MITGQELSSHSGEIIKHMNKRHYSRETVVKALKMYTDNRSFKEIQEELDLPGGNKGDSLISHWRARCGIEVRQKIIR